jgi:hypothetical protein
LKGFEDFVFTALSFPDAFNIPGVGSLACRSFSAKAALSIPHRGINFQSWLSTPFYPKG